MAGLLRIVLGAGDGGGRPAPDRARGLVCPDEVALRSVAARVAGRRGLADGDR